MEDPEGALDVLGRDGSLAPCARDGRGEQAEVGGGHGAVVGVVEGQGCEEGGEEVDEVLEVGREGIVTGGLNLVRHCWVLGCRGRR